jgi:hypothetical protein
MSEKDAGGMQRGMLGKLASEKASEADICAELEKKMVKMKELAEKRGVKKPAAPPEVAPPEVAPVAPVAPAPAPAVELVLEEVSTTRNDSNSNEVT